MSRNLTLGETPAPGQHGTDSRSWQPRGGPRCVCGVGTDEIDDEKDRFIDPQVARRIGVDGVVPACPRCYYSHESNSGYEPVARAVRHFYAQDGYRPSGIDIDADAHPEVSGDE